MMLLPQDGNLDLPLRHVTMRRKMAGYPVDTIRPLPRYS